LALRTPPAERCDISDQRDAEESTDSSENAEPMEKADRNEPTDPTDSADPTDPIDSTDPLDPMDRMESSDHRAHFDVCVSGSVMRPIVPRAFDDVDGEAAPCPRAAFASRPRS
jgi:hypothetical protein